MALLEPNLDPTPRDLRWFGLLWFPAFFGLVGWLVLAGTGSWTAALALWVGALAVSGVGLLVPKLLLALYLGWMHAVYPIGWTLSHLAMAITFYGVVTSTRLVLALTGRDPLRRRRDDSAETHWLRCETREAVRDYFRQF